MPTDSFRLRVKFFGAVEFVIAVEFMLEEMVEFTPPDIVTGEHSPLK